MPTNVVILAAGMGTRLRPHTSNSPKALVKVSEVSILERQLNIVKEYGLDHLIIVVGYKGDMIKRFVDGMSLECKVTYLENHDYDSTGCSWSLVKAIEAIKGGFVYINCDLLFSRSNYEILCSSDYKNLILVRSISNSSETILQKAEVVDNRIKRMDLTLSKPYEYESIGPVKISSNGRERLIQIFYSLSLKKQLKIRCYTLLGVFAQTDELNIEVVTDDSWIEVNTPEDKAVAETKIKRFY